jgi:hypothetical protein
LLGTSGGVCKDTGRILSKLTSQEPLVEEELSAHDIVVDLIHNHSEVEHSLTGLGSAGEFPINIMRFGTVYWIEAPEFDDIGYFDSVESARQCAEGNYEPFITAAEQEGS